MKTSTSAPEIMSWDEIKQAMAETDRRMKESPLCSI
jgi:hypothetical protein